MGETVFASLLVDADQLHLDGVAHLEDVFHVLDTAVSDLGDMQEAVGVGQELHEGTEGGDVLDFSFIHFAHLGFGADELDALHGGVDVVHIGSGDIDDAEFTHLLNIDGGVGLTLHLLDDLASRSDNGADELARDLHLDDARHEGTVVLTRCRHGLFDLAEDEHTASVSLGQCLCQHFGGESVDLDVHLTSGDTVFGTTDLEVHVAEVVLIAEDVGQDGVAAGVLVGNQTHGDTGDRFFHLDTAVEQGQGAGADGSHGGAAVGLEDVGDDTHGVGECRVVEGDHGGNGTLGQVAVTDLATASAADTLHLTHAERREVVVEHETAGAFHHSAVNHLLVQLGTQRTGGQSLGLTTGEDGGTMGGREVAGLDPDGTDGLQVTTVETDALI